MRISKRSDKAIIRSRAWKEFRENINLDKISKRNVFFTGFNMAYKIIKQLQKEINSQTEQNSDKEVAQPYSKSDTTTKEIGRQIFRK